MTLDTPVIPARMSVDALKRLAANNDVHAQITWQWVGRHRHGVLTLTKDGKSLFSERFARSTQIWGRGDETLDLVRTGSNKHVAVIRALEALQSLFGPPNKPAVAGTSLCSGIRDTLIE